MPHDLDALRSEWRLPHARATPALARRLVRERLTGRVAPDRLEDAVLLTDELVTNAVTHAPPLADGTIGVQLAVVDDVVRIAVTDGGRRFDWSKAEPDLQGPGGLGLHVVDRLSARWGLSRDGVKAVWCELPARPSGRGGAGGSR